MRFLRFLIRCFKSILEASNQESQESHFSMASVEKGNILQFQSPPKSGTCKFWRSRTPLESPEVNVQGQALWYRAAHRVLGQTSAGDSSVLLSSECAAGSRPGAFAAILADGSVVTWGKSEAGGDSSTVQNQLCRVQQVSTEYAFVAILSDGSVITWGTDLGVWTWGDPGVVTAPKPKRGSSFKCGKTVLEQSGIPKFMSYF